MHANSVKSFEPELSSNAQQNIDSQVSLKSSYKLRAYYSLLLMKSKEIHNALYDLVSAFSSINVDIYRTPELDYLNSYNPDSPTSLELVNSVYEVLCQAHDEMYENGYEIYQVFRGFPSIRNLIISPDDKEEYRPSEELPFEQIVDMASSALEFGSYDEAKSVVSDLINFPIELELDLISMEMSGEKLPPEVKYVKINRELAEYNAYLTDKDDMLLELSDEEIHKHFRGPIDNLKRAPKEALVSRTVWDRIKSSCNNVVSSAVENMGIAKSSTENALENVGELEHDYDNFTLNADIVDESDVLNSGSSYHPYEEEEFVENINPEYLKTPLVRNVAPNFLFEGLKKVDSTELDGYYGYIRLFGLITIQKNVFVKNRSDIKKAEKCISKLIKWCCTVNWLTKNGTPVAYY